VEMLGENKLSPPKPKNRTTWNEEFKEHNETTIHENRILEVFFYSAHLWVILLHCASIMLFSKWKLVSLSVFFFFSQSG